MIAMAIAILVSFKQAYPKLASALVCEIRCPAIYCTSDINLYSLQNATDMNATKIQILLGTITTLILMACGIFFMLGGVVNTGSSIPAGLYWKVDKPLAVGKTVVFCPPNLPAFQDARNGDLIEGGSCPDNYASLMLKVAGKPKNVVTVNEDGVYVNDILLPKSKPLGQDKEGRPMPTFRLNHYELKDNEVLLMSDSDENAFDGRYFGPIETDQVDSVISPIFQ